MTVRLIKQNQKIERSEQKAEEPSPNQIMLTTQSWVQEFKARKAKGGDLLNILTKPN